MAGWIEEIMMLHVCCWYQSSVEIVSRDLLDGRLDEGIMMLLHVCCLYQSSVEIVSRDLLDGRVD